MATKDPRRKSARGKVRSRAVEPKRATRVRDAELRTARDEFEEQWAVAKGHMGLLSIFTEWARDVDAEGHRAEIEHSESLASQLDQAMRRAALAALDVLRKPMLQWRTADRWTDMQRVRLAGWLDGEPDPDEEPGVRIRILALRLGTTPEALRALLAEHEGDRVADGREKASARVVGKIEKRHSATIEKAPLAGPFFGALAKMDDDDDKRRARGSLSKLALDGGMMPPIPRPRSASKK